MNQDLNEVLKILKAFKLNTNKRLEQIEETQKERSERCKESRQEHRELKRETGERFRLLERKIMRLENQPGNFSREISNFFRLLFALLTFKTSVIFKTK